MAARAASKMFVAKLPWTASRETLAEHFQQFGKVIFSKVVFVLLLPTFLVGEIKGGSARKDQQTGRSKRYGFVVFESPDALESALSEREHSIDGSKVVVQVMTNDDKNRKKTESEV